MKKRVFLILSAFILSVIPVFTVSAAEGAPRLIDEADLLSDSEESALLGSLDEISERQKMDIVVVTENSLEGKSAMEYADDFYDENGYGFGEGRDGILFLVSMEERDWHISTRGYGITTVTDAGREYMSGQLKEDLSGGEYAAAFMAFAGLCDDYITQARNGEPYDVGNLPKEPFWFGGCLGISLGIAFVISLIVTGVMKSKLKTVHSQSGADTYVKRGGLKLTKENDLFLYRHIDRREKPKEEESAGGSDTHTSSSGATHGGGGGKF